MLTGYFAQNIVDEFARGILYQDFPEFYTWHSNGKFWQRRVHAGRKQVGRIVFAHPTFREAAKRRGLIEEDNTLDDCLTEASMFQMPSSLRRLFATILVFCEPSDVFALWQKHLDAMSEDYQ